jgi:hypothetical protein
MAQYNGFSSSPQLVTQVTVDLGAAADAGVTEYTLTVPGAIPGMFFIVAAPDLEADLGIVGAYSDTVGEINLRIVNPTALAINPASQTFYILGL